LRLQNCFDKGKAFFDNLQEGMSYARLEAQSPPSLPLHHRHCLNYDLSDLSDSFDSPDFPHSPYPNRPNSHPLFIFPNFFFHLLAYLKIFRIFAAYN
jgi:hypothetical protein